MRRLLCLLCPIVLVVLSWAASNSHVISFGQSFNVKLFTGSADDKAVDMNIRALYVDGRVKEFTTGDPHEVTDTVLVIRKVYRVNEPFSEAGKTPPQWKWQRGGWLSVDRSKGRVSSVYLPDFDPFYSAASWYQDYVAYCGVSGNAEKAYAVVARWGSRKPIVHKSIGAAKGAAEPDSECPAPHWEHEPVRVTFTLPHDKLSFEIHGRAADLQIDKESTDHKDSSR